MNYRNENTMQNTSIHTEISYKIRLGRKQRRVRNEHVGSMPQNSLPRIALDVISESRRSVGRPAMRWRESYSLISNEMDD